MKRHRFPVIDLFAGPGGLGEGFSAFGSRRGSPRFRIALSIEMERWAHQTLELRSFYHQFPRKEVPEEYYAHLRGEITRDQLFEKFPLPQLRAHKRGRQNWEWSMRPKWIAEYV